MPPKSNHSQSLSCIIPTLNEELRIGQRLQELTSLPGLDEIIIVDGGSKDDTVEIVRSFSSVRLEPCARGRARQMNAGARLASGTALVFLHADVQLPSDAAKWVHRTLAKPAVIAGAFRTWTIDDSKRERRAPWLHLADIRSRYSKLPYGDQALFVSRAVFHSVGGFRDIPLMEDLELSRRLRRIGTIETVPATVRVSGRRFLANPIRDTALVNIFPLLYRAGVSPATLIKLYQNIR